MKQTVLLDTARKGALAYIGAIALTGDTLSHTGDTLSGAIKRAAVEGKKLESDLQSRVRRSTYQALADLANVAEAVQERADQARDMVGHAQQRLFDALHLPTHTSLEDLKIEVARLNAELDGLQGKGRRRGASGRAEATVIPDYEKLNADAVVARLPDLDEWVLLSLHTYERQHAARVTVLRAIERVLVSRREVAGAPPIPNFRTMVEPLPHYDELSPEELTVRLMPLHEPELLHVRAYERDHAARPELLAVLDERLAAKRSL